MNIQCCRILHFLTSMKTKNPNKGVASLCSFQLNCTQSLIFFTLTLHNTRRKKKFLCVCMCICVLQGDQKLASMTTCECFFKVLKVDVKLCFDFYENTQKAAALGRPPKPSACFLHSYSRTHLETFLCGAKCVPVDSHVAMWFQKFLPDGALS